MTTRFVCLANSYKEGGRCIAGIELDDNNRPVIKNGHPKWIRPVCRAGFGEVPAEMVSNVSMLDIVEINIVGCPEFSFQSENVFFEEVPIAVTGKFPCDNLELLCWDRPTLFGNKGRAVHKEKIEMLAYSLMFIRLSDFAVIDMKSEKTNKNKTRLVFTYNDIAYDLPVTDPVFLHDYAINHRLLQEAKELFVCTSLGIEWDGWYFKLIAGIIMKK